MQNGYIITAYRKDRPKNIFTMLQTELIKLLESWDFIVEEATGYTKEHGVEPVLVARASRSMSPDMDIAVAAIAAFIGQDYVLMLDDGQAYSITLEAKPREFHVDIEQDSLGLLQRFHPADLPEHTCLLDGTILTIVNTKE